MRVVLHRNLCRGTSGPRRLQDRTPRLPACLAKDVRTAGMRVRPETYRWQADIEARVRAGRYDAVVEAPLAHPQEFLAGMAAYRQAGYRIEIVALAVPEAASQLGILDSYLRLAEDGQARYVSWDNHDTCAAALLSTLTTVEAGRLADRVLVARRSADPALEAAGQTRRGVRDGPARRRKDPGRPDGPPHSARSGSHHGRRLQVRPSRLPAAAA